MKSFKEYYSATMIVEGGNAVKTSTRINQPNVEATLKDIYKNLLPSLKLKVKDTELLGSTGKKLPEGSSGDIDLAISIPALLKNNKVQTLEEIHDHIIAVSNKVSHEVFPATGIGVISLAWPIANTDGKQEGEFVQLDLMLSDNIEWSKWAFHSPAEWESKWKGLYRNLILINVAKNMKYNVLSTAMDKSGKVIDAEFERNFFDLNKGLMHGLQTRIGKSGNIVKTKKTLDKIVVSQDPNKVAKMLFGPKFSSSQLLTWDDAFNAVTDKNFVYKEQRDRILKGVAQSIMNLGVPIPKELKPWA